MKRKGKKKWSFPEWQAREKEKKTRTLVESRKRLSAEKNAAAIIVFILREPLRAMFEKWQEEADKTQALTKFEPLDIPTALTRAPRHQDEVCRLISETPSLMLFLEFLISQAAASSNVERSQFYQSTIEEVCILVEGYQMGLQQGLDVGEHIMGIPNDEKSALALWERLSEASDDEGDEDAKICEGGS